jgi:hypothetical protein
MPIIDTAEVHDRRQLQFNTVAELRAEIDRIAAAERAGTLRRTGNWSAGQVFGHLAAWINFAYEGYPMRVPWFVRPFIRRKLKQYLEGQMDAGVRIPRVEGGTYGTEALSTEEGAARLRTALDRMEREPARYDSPAFGKLPEEQRIKLNLRHAELHFGFLHPE